MSTRITVSSSQQIAPAVASLAAAGGGTVALAASARPYDLDLRYVGSETSRVTITSADPGDPAIVASTLIYRSKGLTLDGLRFETGTPDGKEDIRILQSQKIAITDNAMQGVADGFLEGRSGVTRGDGLLFIRDSSEVAFSDNVASGYFHGIGLLDNQQVTISGNDISGIQGDGIRGGGQTGLVIEANYMHDFHGALQSVTHTDMIQLWGSYSKVPNSDVTITGNVLFTGEGAATQGILIRNEVFGARTPSGGYFHDISITDNLIYNGARNGIYVADTTKLKILGNSLFWDADATTKSRPGAEPGSSPPWIALNNIGTADVSGNITAHITSDRSFRSVAGDNLTVLYGAAKEQSAAHVGQLVTAFNTDVVLPQDLLIDRDSVYHGRFGADPALPWLTNASGLLPVMDVDPWAGDLLAATLSAHVFDRAGTALDLRGATVRWQMEDGTRLTGEEVSVAFDAPGKHAVELAVTDAAGRTSSVTRTLVLEDPVLVSLDFEGTLEDRGSRDTVSYLTGSASRSYTAGRDGRGFHLTDATEVQVERTTSYIHGLNRFRLDMDVRSDHPNKSGTLAEMFGAFRLDLTEGGALRAWLTTDEGRFATATSETVLGDRAWHAITVSYDSSAASLQIIGDGTLLAQTAATGITSQATVYPLVIGSTFNNPANAIVDNFVFSKPASAEALELLGETPQRPKPPETPVASAEPERPAGDLLFLFDFEKGLQDVSGRDTKAAIPGVSVGMLGVSGQDGLGMKIRDRTSLDVSRSNKHISDLDAFTLGVSVKKDSADATGVLLTIFRTMDLEVLETGALRAWMTTSRGTYAVETAGGVIDDTQWHEVALDYSDASREMRLLVDGAEVGSTAAGGAAPKITYWGLTAGDPWNDTLDATIDNFYMIA